MLSVPSEIVKQAYDRSLEEKREVTIWQVPCPPEDYYLVSPTMAGKPRADALCVATVRVCER